MRFLLLIRTEEDHNQWQLLGQYDDSHMAEAMVAQMQIRKPDSEIMLLDSLTKEVVS